MNESNPNPVNAAEESDEQPYNVAISFLSADEPTARALADQLESSGLRVFFFPRSQEELAGTDGLETMRKPFLDAQVAVVFYRDRWGQRLGHAWKKRRSRIAASIAVGSHLCS